ncbi:RloB family protein [Bifidobacterium aemilianum]|uniref:RloB family protein n=1 Tax=Bifidobacterium aemilianum TaxID=2493120 RepID=UPI0038B2F7F6
MSVDCTIPSSDPVDIVTVAAQAVNGDADAGIAKGFFDQVWAVFDLDGRDGQVRRACDLAADNGVHAALSNPCFDVWLIWHFADFSRPGCPASGGSSSTDRYVRQHCPSYGKGKHNRWNQIVWLTADAMAHARQRGVCREGGASAVLQADPSSGVCALIEAADRCHTKLEPRLV